MRACSLHVQDDPNPQCARRAAPPAKEPGCRIRTDALRLPSGRSSTSGRATHARRDAGQDSRPTPTDLEDPGRGRHPGEALVRVIVLDASALLEFLLQTPRGTRVETRLLRDEDEFHSPHLVDVEVTQGLRRLVRAGQVAPGRAAEAIADLADLDLHRHPHLDLLSRAWKLRENVTAYDAMYVALA